MPVINALINDKWFDNRQTVDAILSKASRDGIDYGAWQRLFTKRQTALAAFPASALRRDPWKKS